MTARVTTIYPIQDYVLINGERSPGKVTPRGWNSPRPWDVRKGYATSGATLVPQGDDLAKGSLFFEFWDDEQVDLMAAWYAFAAKYFDKAVRFTPGSSVPRALGIFHPALAAPPIRVTAVVVEDVTQLEQDDTGAWTCEVKLIQYRRPKPALSPPQAVIPGTQKAQPTAQDAADRMIEQLSKQIQALAG